MSGGIVDWLTGVATVTITGTPAFTIFVSASQPGALFRASTANPTWSGSATGTRASATNLSQINIFGAGATYLPGNVNGTGDAATFALYG